MTKKISLWINNQPTDSDCTADYIRATGWAAPAGVTLDLTALTLSTAGPPGNLWEAYHSLREAVAAVGHGEGCEDMPPPRLTACPLETVHPRYVSIAESLARHQSVEF